MINTQHLLKVTAAWISIVYLVCFGGVALIPGIRSWFMEYALHTTNDMGQNVITLGTFLLGLLIWNVVAVVAVWLFAALFNSFKK